MASNKVTHNIYDSWVETASTYIDTMYEHVPYVHDIKGLMDFSKEEIHHLIWLLVEELNSREAKIKEEK